MKTAGFGKGISQLGVAGISGVLFWYVIVDLAGLLVLVWAHFLPAGGKGGRGVGANGVEAPPVDKNVVWVGQNVVLEEARKMYMQYLVIFTNPRL